jgi:hypothetical protein
MDVLKRRSWLVAACLVALFSSRAQAEDTLKLGEQQIKAGLLYNFLKYTQWPAASFAQSASVNVCIFGGDPFGGSLKPMEGRSVNQREIAVRQVSEAREIDGCHLLFVNAGQKEHWPALRTYLAGKNILTVSDFDDFSSSGGMIEFGRKDHHITASLNIDAVAAAGLRVEDRLLRLVTVVQGGQP